MLSSNGQLVNASLSTNDVNFASVDRHLELTEDKEMNVIVEEDVSRIFVPSGEAHCSNFSDLDALQKEAVWLESAIRARINVSDRAINRT